MPVLPVPTGAATAVARVAAISVVVLGASTHVKCNDRRSATVSSASRTSIARSIAPTKPRGGRITASLSSEADRSQVSVPNGRPADIDHPTGRPVSTNAASPLAPASDKPSGITSSALPGGARRTTKRVRGEFGCSLVACARGSIAACVCPMSRGSVEPAWVAEPPAPSIHPVGSVRTISKLTITTTAGIAMAAAKRPNRPTCIEHVSVRARRTEDTGQPDVCGSLETDT